MAPNTKSVAKKLNRGIVNIIQHELPLLKFVLDRYCADLYGGFLRKLAEHVFERGVFPSTHQVWEILESTDIDFKIRSNNNHKKWSTPTIVREIYNQVKKLGGFIEYAGFQYGSGNLEGYAATSLVKSPASASMGNYMIWIPHSKQEECYIRYDMTIGSEANYFRRIYDYTVNGLCFTGGCLSGLYLPTPKDNGTELWGNNEIENNHNIENNNNTGNHNDTENNNGNASKAYAEQDDWKVVQKRLSISNDLKSTLEHIRDKRMVMYPIASRFAVKRLYRGRKLWKQGYTVEMDQTLTEALDNIHKDLCPIDHPKYESLYRDNHGFLPFHIFESDTKSPTCEEVDQCIFPTKHKPEKIGYVSFMTNDFIQHVYQLQCQA